MKHSRSLGSHTRQNSYNPAISTLMEQANILSRSHKRKQNKMLKVLPLYHRDLHKHDYYYDSFVESLGIHRDDYVELCEYSVRLYWNIERTSMRPAKLRVLRTLNSVGVALILGMVAVSLVSTLILTINNEKVSTLMFTVVVLVYILVVTCHCVYYLVNILQKQKSLAENIRKFNMHIFKLNLTYKSRGLEFSVRTSAKELLIRKLL